MRLAEYDERDGRKVWLSNDEVELLLDQPDDLLHEIALSLGARCGLRAREIVSVRPQDVVEGPAGKRVRVEEGKGDRYRETPLPESLYQTMRAVGRTRDEADTAPFIDRTPRTLERWVDRYAEACEGETGDPGWSYLGPHDLRRTWGTLLVGADVEPGLIMEWGGWSDWDTFREHYLGAFSPEMEREQVEKVDWL